MILGEGNATSRDRVQEGELQVGFTDTDDVQIGCGRREPCQVNVDLRLDDAVLLDDDGPVNGTHTSRDASAGRKSVS